MDELDPAALRAAASRSDRNEIAGVSLKERHFLFHSRAVSPLLKHRPALRTCDCPQGPRRAGPLAAGRSRRDGGGEETQEALPFLVCSQPFTAFPRLFTTVRCRSLLFMVCSLPFQAAAAAEMEKRGGVSADVAAAAEAKESRLEVERAYGREVGHTAFP